MPKTLSKALSQRLRRSPRLRRNLEDVHAISGQECVFLDEWGNERLRVPREGCSPLREAMRQSPRVREEVVKQRLRQLTTGEEDREIPWMEIMHPVKIGGELVGTWVLSAWRHDFHREVDARRIWAGWAAQGEGLSWRDWQQCWLRLPVCSPATAEAWERLLLRLTRDVLQSWEEEVGQVSIPDQLPPAVQRACKVVQARYHEPLTLAEVARESGISPEHLSREFHRHTGLRFREYLAETRIQEVCVRLRESQDPIAELAHEAGFSTLSRFNRCFREITGTTPREWRKGGGG